MAAPGQDVNDMFEKMGQKLGWFKHKDLDTALKALSGSSQKKPSKLRLKKTSNKTINKPTGNTNKNKQAPVSRNLEVKAPKPQPNMSKASSFKGFLSSDSDSSEFEDARDGPPKIILQVASDSEEDASVYREDTYVSCIGESPLKSNRPSLAPSTYDSSHHRQSLASYDYEESILKSRVSMSTFSLDLDSIGDPLVESTRIHRRSSVTYRQIISPDSSSGSIHSGGGSKETSPCLPKNKSDSPIPEEKKENDMICSELKNLTIQRGQHHAANGDIDNTSDDMLGPSVLMHHDETKYSTAIDNLKDLDITDVDTENCKNDINRSDESVDTRAVTDKCGTAIKEGGSADRKCHRLLKEGCLDAINESSSDSDVEVIEVVDVATQTEGEAGTELYTQSEDSVYCNDTVHDNPVYDQATVDQDSIDEIQTTEIMSDPIEYEQSTMNRGEQDGEIPGNQDDTEPGTSCKYNDDTNTKSAGSLYEQETIGMEPLTENSKDDAASSCNETSGHSSLDSGASDYSIVEVMDTGTQTDIPDISHRHLSESDDNEIIENESDDNEMIENESDNNDIIENDASDDDNHSTEDRPDGIDVLDKSTEKRRSSIAEDDGSESFANENHANAEPDHESANEDDEQDSREEKKSSGNFSMLSSDSDSDELDFSAIRQKAEASRKGKAARDRDADKVQKVDTSNQSWRGGRKNSSDSSDDEDKLQAFFQKLRKPEKEKSESESESEQSEDERSLDDFIVEDDDMSSESEDSAFYLQETQRLENPSVSRRLRKTKGSLVEQISSQASDDDEEDFSSKLYPDSVTKHKKQIIGKPRGTPRSWSFSSDSDETSSGSEHSPQQRTETGAQGRNNPRPGGLNLPKPKGNVTKKMNFSDVSSDSESDNQLLFKTPNPIRRTKKTVKATGKENKPKLSPQGSVNKDSKGKTPKSKALPKYISLLSDNSDDEDSFQSIASISSSTDNTSSANVSSTVDSLFKLPTPVSKGRQARAVTPLATRGSHTYSFLKSLSASVEEEGRRHPDAIRYVKSFKKNMEELTKNLFSLYNRTIFDGKMPSDLPIIWNKRLLRTAGYCAYKRRRDKQEERTARVELSTKVCDSAERVRDTLIHELCHAAVWLLNGVNGGHGPFWKYWARQANKVHVELPAIGRCHSYSINTKFTYSVSLYYRARQANKVHVELPAIGRCHSYSINTKFTYRCTKCGYSIGRHSKSLDTEKKVCGRCRGRFELIQNDTPTTPRSAISSAPSTPRTPNKFALFVKENYNSVKQKDKSLKHGDVMKELSKLFADSKITS